MNPTIQALDFCPELTALYSRERVRAPSGKEFTLGACSTVNNLVILKKLFAHIRPKRSLEIGMAFGGSCLMLAALYQQAGESPAAQHVAIDPFQTSLWEQLGIRTIERAGLAGFVEVREQLSNLLLPKMVERNEQFNLIYIDGSHLFEDVFIDAYYSFQLIARDGIVVFDDCRDPHVRKVIRFLRTNMSSPLREVDLSPFRAEGTNGFKYHLARAVGLTQAVAFQRVGSAVRPWDAAFRTF